MQPSTIHKNRRYKSAKHDITQNCQINTYQELHVFSNPRITINTGSVVFSFSLSVFQREGGKGELFCLRHGHEFSQQVENWHYRETWLTPEQFHQRQHKFNKPRTLRRQHKFNKHRIRQRQYKFNKRRIHQRLFRFNKGKTRKVKRREIWPCRRKKNLR